MNVVSNSGIGSAVTVHHNLQLNMRLLFLLFICFLLWLLICTVLRQILTHGRGSNLKFVHALFSFHNVPELILSRAVELNCYASLRAIPTLLAVVMYDHQAAERLVMFLLPATGKYPSRVVAGLFIMGLEAREGAERGARAVFERDLRGSVKEAVFVTILAELARDAGSLQGAEDVVRVVLAGEFLFEVFDFVARGRELGFGSVESGTGMGDNCGRFSKRFDGKLVTGWIPGDSFSSPAFFGVRMPLSTKS